MKLLSLLMMLSAALATSSDDVPVCLDEGLCWFEECELLEPICQTVPRSLVLWDVAKGHYFQPISDKEVLYKAPSTRGSSHTERWVTEPRTDDSLCRYPDCRVIPYEAAKSVYDEFKSLGEPSQYNLSFILLIASTFKGKNRTRDEL